MGLFVYITAPSPEAAERLAVELVERRLAAGVNIVPAVSSVYRWKGVVCRAEETALLVKTAKDRFDDLVRAVLRLHSYETPCIVAWPVERGYAPFLEWLNTETRPEA